MKQQLVKFIRQYTTTIIGPGFRAAEDMRLRGPWTYVEDLSPMQTRKMDATLQGHIPITRGPLGAGDTVPQGYHFAYFNGLESETELTAAGCVQAAAPDPQLFPVRMWAGGSIEFNAKGHPLTLGNVGRAVERVARVEYKCKPDRLVEKSGGGNGCLQERLFVTFERRMYAGSSVSGESGGGGLGDQVAASHATSVAEEEWSVKEERTMVYLSNRNAPSRSGEPPFLVPKYTGKPAFSHTFTPSLVTLFRYSAVTFNGYRIHYDPRYSAEEEGLAGCLVHGPLTATVVLALATEMQQQGLGRIPADRRIVRYRYRMLAPLWVENALTIHFGELDEEMGSLVVWITDQRGSQCVDGAIEVD